MWAASGGWCGSAGSPGKYYDLGDDYSGYDFFAKCPTGSPAPAAPSTSPRKSRKGQPLSIKAGPFRACAAALDTEAGPNGHRPETAAASGTRC